MRNRSGDWGGGTGLGEAAIWHAARDADRRGPETSLTRAVPRAFGVTTVAEVTEGIHLGRIAYGDLALLASVVFEHADNGDATAGLLVDRQGREIAILAVSCLERLDLLEVQVPVVLGGGILAVRHERLWAALESELWGARTECDDQPCDGSADPGRRAPRARERQRRDRGTRPCGRRAPPLALERQSARPQP